jgi:toxin-antitoxin system PIN domain toxin
MILVDSNLLVYAYNADAPEHDRARRWWEETMKGEEAIGLAWVVILAFIRLTTAPQLFKTPLSCDEACRFVDAWLEQAAVEIVQPTPRHWTLLKEQLQIGQASAKLTTDAHLAALAIEHGATLYTSDRDFTRFPGLKFVNPLDTSASA